MSLSVGKPILVNDLLAIYSDVKELRSYTEMAHRFATAVHKFFISGIPTTVLLFPSSQAAVGTGLGGFDKPAPGMGLASAQPILKSEFITIWTHNNANIAASIYAEKMAQAIYNYYSQAKIQTIDTAPPTTGPDVGIGGVFKPAPGAGYGPKQPDFENDLVSIWRQVGSPPVTVPVFAELLSQAIHKYAIEGIVHTAGTRAETTGTALGTVS